MTTWESDIVGALEDLGGSGTYGQIYAAVEKRRSSLPSSWQEIVRRMIQDRSSDSSGYKGKSDLFFTVEGLGKGVWGLRALLELPPVGSDVDLSEGVAVPGRTQVMTYRVLRDTAMARKVKLLHENECQMCGTSLRISSSRTYAEAHHIVPLGRNHAGPDVPSNILVLCPNHHALCDMGAVRLRRSELKEVPGHEIAQASLDYHNERIFGKLY